MSALQWHRLRTWSREFLNISANIVDLAEREAILCLIINSPYRLTCLPFCRQVLLEKLKLCRRGYGHLSCILLTHVWMKISHCPLKLEFPVAPSDSSLLAKKEGFHFYSHVETSETLPETVLSGSWCNFLPDAAAEALNHKRSVKVCVPPQWRSALHALIINYALCIFWQFFSY